MDKDPIRRNDSLITFEEILQIARKHDVCSSRSNVWASIMALLE
jgi:hypothetical protein